MAATAADTVSGSYAAGWRDGTGAATEAEAFAPLNLNAWELREAADSWRRAQFEHAHTSYYGAAHIRAMRAYWIARRRAIRAGVPRYAPCAVYGGDYIGELWRARDRLTGDYVPTIPARFAARGSAEACAANLNDGARLLAEMRDGYAEVRGY